ncbi:Uncharacterised protein [Mycobacteroides abscessus subsp. massiliense]|nr:Uncharacterised protein [Mycobacteroides abscessus subsp. massiliense]
MPVTGATESFDSVGGAGSSRCTVLWLTPVAAAMARVESPESRRDSTTSARVSRGSLNQVEANSRSQYTSQDGYPRTAHARWV